MKRSALIIVSVVVIIIALFGVVFVGCGPKEAEVKVPINAQGAENVGALHIELAYDPDVLKATGVTKGTLAGNAMIEYNLDTSDLIVISMVDSAGMNGSGSLAVVTFQIVGQTRMTSSLTLENLTAWDASNVFDIPIESSAGSFVVKQGVLTPPVIEFAP